MPHGSASLPACRCSPWAQKRSEEHTSELQSQSNLVCRLLLEKKKRLQQHDFFASSEFSKSAEHRQRVCYDPRIGLSPASTVRAGHDHSFATSPERRLESSSQS